jgi:glucokinase
VRVLAGDIGGTNTRLAVYDVEGDTLEALAQRIYPSRGYSGLEHVVAEFLRTTGFACERAAFGVAGPVAAGRAATTNLPWLIEARIVARETGIPEVRLINDLEALAWGLGQLGEDDFAVVNRGRRADGDAAIVAAGTGLGVSLLIWDGERWRPSASEGGHSGFAPRSELDMALHRHLAARYGRVSRERVVSGPALVDIHEFLARERQGEVSERLAQDIADGNGPAVITRAALDSSDPLCVEALDLFVSHYGAVAGDVALEVFATGGIFLGGGIAPRIVPRLESPVFLDAFRDKGRMTDLVTKIPVKVILNPLTGLMGAGRYAASPPRPPAP